MSERDFPLWQAPFRALFGLAAAALVMVIPVIAIAGFLFSITFIMWFFGIRDSVWPVWPF